MTDFVNFLVSLVTIIYINYKFGFIIFLLSFVPILLTKKQSTALKKYKQNYSLSFENLISKTKNMLDGFNIIKAFGIEKNVLKNFNDINNRIEDDRYKSKFSSYLLEIVVVIISTGIFFTSYIIGGYFAYKGIITVGTLTMMLQLSNNISNPMQRVPRYFAEIRSMELIFKKLQQTINLKSSFEEGTISKERFFDNINIKNLSFAYDEKPLLNDLNLSFKKNKKYAIIGGSGCGKSTFIKILSGIYSDYTGNIYLDEVNLKNLTSSSKTNLISLIDQDVFLFNDTIKNNICLYQDYSDEKIKNVLIQSGLETLINKLDEGIDTCINENGSNLSGGEKQRICIARALIKDSPIIILDEATSALDVKLKDSIENTILSLEGKTIIVVTHDVNRLKKYNFEEIISFDKILNPA
jgi:ATP-binding cassette subfamily C protein